MNTTYNDSLIKTNSFTYSSSFPHLLTFNNSNSFVYDGLYLKQIKNYMGQVIKQFNYRGTKITSIQEPLQNKTVIFDYDYKGRRSKKLNQTANDLVEYYYDENLLIKEKHSNYSLNFLYNENNELIGFEHISSNNSAKTKYFYLRNVFNDIVEVLDENGNSLVHYLYDAFGNTIETIDNSSISLGAINPFRYRGYYYDVETQLFWVSTRYYSPELCRWISPDSIEYLDPESINGLNLYAYCANDPVNNYDPSGHFAISAIIIGAIIGAVVGFGTAMYIDYQDDGKIFNGSVKWYDYLGAIVLGGVIGAGLGAFAGMNFSASLPTGLGMVQTTSGTSILAASGSITLTITGSQILGAAGLLGAVYLFAKGGLPNNKHQNKQWAEAMRQLGIENKDLWRRLHDEIQKYPFNTHDNLRKLIKLLKEILKKWGLL